MAKLVKKITLIFSDAGTGSIGSQHNKTWIGELYDDQTVITRWGRIGYDLQSKEFPGAGEHFLLNKEASKLKKGYTPAKTIDISVSTPIVMLDHTNLRQLAKSQIVKSSNKIKNEFAKGMLEGSIIVYSHSIEALENLIK